MAWCEYGDLWLRPAAGGVSRGEFGPWARGIAVLLAVAPGMALGGCAKPECELRSTPGSASDGFDAAGFCGDVLAQVEDSQPKGFGLAFTDARGDLRGVGYGGLARDARGDRVPFSADTFNNWGSVSKVVTAAAAIHAVDGTPGTSLDEPFGDYLPLRWQESLHADYASVTIRMLLQHRGGFDRDGEIYYESDAGEPIDLLGGRLSRPAEGSVGARSYSNLSPILLHFVVAYMTAPEAMAQVEAELPESLPEGEYSKAINLAAAERFVDYARQQLLEPAEVGGSCNITDFEDHAYTYVSDRDDGVKYPRKAFGGEHTDECSAGGWVLSPRGMVTLLAALRHGGQILAPESYAQMENDSASGRFALGYNEFAEVTGGLAFCHGGAYHGVRAAVCSFPNGVQVAVNVNSEISIGSEGLELAVIEAYEGALGG